MRVCEMLNPHHPDCECKLCKAHQDEVCGRPAVAVLRDCEAQDEFPVCKQCAEMAAEDPDAYGVLRYLEVP